MKWERRQWTIYCRQDGGEAPGGVVCHLDHPDEYQLQAVDSLIVFANQFFLPQQAADQLDEVWAPKGVSVTDNIGNTFVRVRDEGDKTLWRRSVIHNP